MNIYIFTYRRGTSQLTLSSIPRSWRRRTFVVCDAEDRAVIQRHYDVDGLRFLVPACVNTIAQKRAWLLRTTKQEKIVMMDDDLRFSFRWEEGYSPTQAYNARFRKATEEEIEDHLEQLELRLDEAAHAGFAARQGSQARPPGWERNTRMIYTLGYRVDIVREYCEIGRIEHREDMDLTLQLLTQGFHNLVSRDLVADQIYNKKGGASEQRTMDASNADAHLLASWFPRYVEVVQRNYKQSVPREEVQVRWKKAYEEAEGC